METKKKQAKKKNMDMLRTDFQLGLGLALFDQVSTAHRNLAAYGPIEDYKAVSKHFIAIKKYLMEVQQFNNNYRSNAKRKK